MPRYRTDNVRVNVFMDPKVLCALKTLAQRRSTTYSQLLRDAAREFVVTELKKEKEGAV